MSLLRVYADGMIRAEGIHASGTTTWTVPLVTRATHARLDTTGVVVPLTRTGPKVYTASGNFAGMAVLYERTPASITLSRIVPKDENNLAAFDREVSVRRISVRTNARSGIGVRLAGLAPEVVRTYEPGNALDDTNERTLEAPIDRVSSLLVMTLESKDDLAMLVSGIEIIGSIRRRFS